MGCFCLQYFILTSKIQDASFYMCVFCPRSRSLLIDSTSCLSYDASKNKQSKLKMDPQSKVEHIPNSYLLRNS